MMGSKCWQPHDMAQGSHTMDFQHGQHSAARLGFVVTFRLTSAEVIASDYTLDNAVSDKTATRWHDAVKDLLLDQQSKQQVSTAAVSTLVSV
jgi:hypothetical protein